MTDLVVNEDRYRRWSRYLKERFGKRVHKVSLDTGAGCPNRRSLGDGGCIFCDSLGGGSGAFLQGLSLEQQVCRGIEGVRRRYKTDLILLYFQGYSATNVSLPRFEANLEKAFEVASDLSTVVGVAVGTRPDLVPGPVLDVLGALQDRNYEVWLELGVQSTFSPSLQWLRRGHGMDPVWSALEGAFSRNLNVCCHLIAGIPGEPEHQLAESAHLLVRKGVQSLKFHPLHVLAGTPLEQLFREGKFRPIELDDYIDEVFYALRRISPQTIIQRISADAHPPRLIAPDWVADKNFFKQRFEASLDESGIRQGDLWESC